MAEPNPSTTEQPPDGVDLAVLAGWMDDHALEHGPIDELRLLAGGTQNVIVRFRRGDRSFVLRRPPVDKRAGSDETMRRESRVLAALATSPVPHPALIAAEPDPSVLGAAFYLMEPVDGFNPTTGLPHPHADDPAIRRRMGFALVEGIAALGAVDHVAVGLGDLGRVEGFLERQVPRWRSQLDSYRDHEGYPGPDIVGVDAVGDWLERHRPRHFVPGILHGDYHLANVMYRPDGPELAAIVDWELCTIGDPLLDLGWVLATWRDEHEVMTTTAVTPWEGFPTVDELVAHYREHSSRDLDAIAWYTVLACYKLGIILEGTHARACAGRAPRATGDMLHAMALALFGRARRLIADS
jgi:aminoglycoside phosphotransferase (APT) family kinase protein